MGNNSENRHTQNEYELTYEKARNRTNSAQKQAIDKIEGPVMVVAGPGTGKTQVLGLRFAHIVRGLQEPNRRNMGFAEPNEILCITFTNAGAEEMRQRVCKYIGPQENLSIFTFHSFCSHLLQKYSEYFPQDKCKIPSDWEKVDFMRTFMREKLPVGHILRKPHNIYEEKKRLKNHFELMDKHRQFFFPPDSASYVDFLQEYIDNLENNQKYIYQKNSGDNKKGDLKIKDIKEERKIKTRTIAACHLYPLFKAEQQKRGFIDYQDLLNKVLDLLQSGTDLAKELLSKLQERYQYIMVDEFQDTSEEQYQIVKLLCDFWGKDSNIFIVGDRNQSIYAFQGTKADNLQAFKQDFISRDEQVIALENNYRSPQMILDLAYAWLDNEKNPILKSQKAVKSATAVSWLCYSCVEESYLRTALQILELRKAGVNWRDIAVLYRKNKEGDNLAKILGKMGIPFQSKKSADILTNPIIECLLQILCYVHKTREYLADCAIVVENSADDLKKIKQIKEALKEDLNAELLELLANPILGDNMLSLWNLWQEYKFGAGENTALTLFEYVQNSQELQAKFPLVSRINACLQLGIKSLEEQLLQFMEILNLADFLPNLRTRNLLFSDPKILEQHISAFIRFVQDCLAENSKFDLAQLLARIAIYREEGLSIEAQTTEGEELVDAVLLSTLHSSKGREFEYVFMLGNKEPGRQNSNEIFALKEREGFDPNKLSNERKEAEERHLIYVGITRTKTQLYIHYPKQKSYIPVENFSQPEHLHNEAWTEEELAQNMEKYELQNIQFESNDKYNSKDKAEPNPWSLDVREYFNEGLFKENSADFALSNSDLQKYLACPLQFYAKKILKWPKKHYENIRLEFGNLTHDLIHKIWEAIIKQQGEIPSLQRVEQILQEIKNEEKNSNISEDLLFALTQDLPVIYDYLADKAEEYKAYGNLSEILNPEKEYKSKGVLKLKGRIDLQIGDAFIVDYKTGNVTLKQELNNKLFLQAQFYRVLLDEYEQKKIGKFIFAQIKDGEVNEYKIDFANCEELNAEFQSLLSITYAKIKRGVFSFAQESSINPESEINGPKLEGCGNCAFCKLFLQ